MANSKCRDFSYSPAAHRQNNIVICVHRSDLESALAERDHLVGEVQRMQAELQSESDALAEGEDAIVEEAAVTGDLSLHFSVLTH